jgi:hypothetical protein
MTTDLLMYFMEASLTELEALRYGVGEESHFSLVDIERGRRERSDLAM